MRRIIALSAALALTITTFSSLPAQATTGDGTYSCSLSGNFTVLNGVVSSGGTCAGTANVPSGVTSIGANAFLGATSLTSVNLPSSLTSIGFAAFKSVTGITAITIPSSVTSIGQQAFFDTRLVSLVIPSSITSIANDTFGRISTLTSITFPNTLTSIGGGAFYDNPGLPAVTIPSSVTSIGDYAFGNALALTSVTFLGNEPATVSTLAFFNVQAGAKAIIGGSATGFAANGSSWKGLTVEQSTDGTYSCSTGLRSNLTPNFTITSGVVSQGQACSGAVVIPSVATSIGANAFNQGTLITSIEIPQTITTITAGSLGGLSSLVAINVNANNANFSSTAGVLFDKLGTNLIRYPAGNTATSYTVSRIVTSISSGAFEGPATLATINFDGNAPSFVGPAAFFGLATGARAVVDPAATGFANIGSTWYGLTVASSVTPPSSNGNSGQSNSAPSVPTPQRQPLSKVSGVLLESGKTSKSSTVKLKLSGVQQTSVSEDIQIKIFDVRGNLFKVLTMPIDGVAASFEVSLPLALGEFTVEASTVSLGGGATEGVAASSPIVSKVFYSTSINKAPVLFGKPFARPVSFKSNSSLLTALEKKALVMVASELKNTKASLAITGFSAEAGASKTFEKALATSRALSVARFLKSQGLSNILYVAGYGTTPVLNNYQAARKVELRIIK